MTVNANSIAKHLIQIKNGIRRNANAVVKNIIHKKNIIVGILAQLFVRMTSILKSIADDSVTVCDEVANDIDGVPKIRKSHEHCFSKCREYCVNKF